MNKFTILLLSLFLFSSLEAKTLDTHKGIELTSEERFDEEGKQNGVDYFAYNTNEHTVYVTIEAVVENNVYDGLANYQVVVSPKEKVHLGWILRASPDKKSSWQVEWEAHTD